MRNIVQPDSGLCRFEAWPGTTKFMFLLLNTKQVICGHWKISVTEDSSNKVRNKFHLSKKLRL